MAVRYWFRISNDQVLWRIGIGPVCLARGRATSDRPPGTEVRVGYLYSTNESVGEESSTCYKSRKPKAEGRAQTKCEALPQRNTFGQEARPGVHVPAHHIPIAVAVKLNLYFSRVFQGRAAMRMGTHASVGVKPYPPKNWSRFHRCLTRR